MIIAKPQQFIIYDCETEDLLLNSLPAEIKNKIFKIFKISQPIGETFLAYLPDRPAPISNYLRLESDNIYLVYTKPGQLGYEIPGAVDPEEYCDDTLFGIPLNVENNGNIAYKINSKQNLGW